MWIVDKKTHKPGKILSMYDIIRTINVTVDFLSTNDAPWHNVISSFETIELTLNWSNVEIRSFILSAFVSDLDLGEHHKPEVVVIETGSQKVPYQFRINKSLLYSFTGVQISQLWNLSTWNCDRLSDFDDKSCWWHISPICHHWSIGNCTSEVLPYHSD